MANYTLNHLSTTRATNSNRSPNQRFKFLHWTLLLTYLTATAGILGGFIVILYNFFSRSLNEQLDNQLLTLAQAGVPSLDATKTKHPQNSDKELPSHALFSSREQSLEWFSADGKLLARVGTHFPPFPLFKNRNLSYLQQGSPVFQQHGQLRTVTIAVYTNDLEQQTLQLEGYIRASESTEKLENKFNQLRWELGLQSMTVLILMSISSVHLSRQTFKPMEQSFKQLKQFIADISHHLRNPLTRIVIAVDLMLGEPELVQPKDAKKLAIISGASEQMQRLVDDLLFLARTEVLVPSTESETVTISLDELLQTLSEKFQEQAQCKGIIFQARLLPGLSVKGDAIYLNRLFSNLLENALKYTQTGGSVFLCVDSSRRRAFVSVEDTGIGIPPENLSSVFQRFWRSEQVQVQQQEGLGLGLAIARAIAKLHGGEITFQSQLGIGSKFRVRLPLV